MARNASFVFLNYSIMFPLVAAILPRNSSALTYGLLNFFPLSSQQICSFDIAIRVCIKRLRYGPDVQKSRQLVNVLADSWK